MAIGLQVGPFLAAGVREIGIFLLGRTARRVSVTSTATCQPGVAGLIDGDMVPKSFGHTAQLNGVFRCQSSVPPLSRNKHYSLTEQ